MKKLIIAAWLLLGAIPVWAKPYEPQIENIEIPPVMKLPAMAPPVDVPSRPLTADEAARIGLRYQSTIAIAKHQITSAEGRTDQLRSATRPQLTVGASYTDILEAANSASIFGTSLATGSVTSSGISSTGGTGVSTSTSSSSSIGTVSSLSENSLALTANIRQLVFDFQHTRDLIKQSEELENAAAGNYTKAQMDTVLNVKTGFYTYVQDIRLTGVQLANVENQREHLKQAQARFKAGLGLPSDVTRAQTAVADAIFNLQQARSDADVARINLVLQMGIDPRIPVEVNDKEEPPLDLAEPQKLFDEALIQRPEMMAAQATLRSYLHGVSAASSTSAPTVSVNFAYTGRLQEGLAQTNALSLVLNVNWTAYDGGLQAGKVKEAEGNVGAAKAQLEGTVQTIISDVAQNYFKLRTAEQKLKTVIVEEANAIESERLAEGRYKVGLGILLDVLDAQSALLTAQVNKINAQSAINVARATLQRSLGKPLGT